MVSGAIVWKPGPVYCSRWRFRRTCREQHHRNGGRQAFTFSALDFAPSPLSDVNYSFTGTLGGSPVFDVGGTLTPPQNFATYLSGVSGLTIDALVIGVNILANTGGDSVNIDNIVLSTAVPEPASLALLGTGLFGLAAVRRRKTA